jgi:hypothetical protein
VEEAKPCPTKLGLSRKWAGAILRMCDWPTVSDYIKKIARLGGYLNRASDPPPGNMVIWRGMSKLNDIHLGFLLGSKTCG